MLSPDKTEFAFMARQLVQATLPHKNPGNVPHCSRTNGGLAVTIQPGVDSKQGFYAQNPFRGFNPRIKEGQYQE